jgi:molybdopterin synthase catalytic subunit
VQIEIILSDDIISTGADTAAGPDTGACAQFTGIVRRQENDQTIGGLVYEAYHAMAEAVMRDILEQIAVEHPCQRVRVQHRLGPIRVGEAAIHIEVHARHRAPAFALLAGFMDRLKQDVPIWKTDTLPC